MQLYHASLGAEPNGVYTHFGSLMAAMHRAETMFAQRETRLLKDGRVHVVGPAWELGRVAGADQIRRVETPQEHLKSFASYLKQIGVYQVDLEFKKLLPVQDCWDDDPIGSGGMKILGADTIITDRERIELASIFQPFTGIIYPEEIQVKLKPSDISRMEREIRTNGIFSQQLAKRRVKLGEAAYALDRPAEVVWQHMTMKLRMWALSRGYDGLSYFNSQEGDGETSFVTLNKNPIKTVQALVVDAEAFFKAASPIYDESLQTRFLKKGDERAVFSSEVVMSDIWSDIWSGINIEQFLSPKMPSSNLRNRSLRSELKK